MQNLPIVPINETEYVEAVVRFRVTDCYHTAELLTFVSSVLVSTQNKRLTVDHIEIVIIDPDTNLPKFEDNLDELEQCYHISDDGSVYTLDRQLVMSPDEYK